MSTSYHQAHLMLFYVFFFQAEDGIRDLTVTGVQTCALPISVWGWPVGDLPAPDGPGALTQMLGRGSRERGAPVVRRPEPDLRMGQRELGERAQARRELGRRRLQELEPGRGVEEEVPHLDGRPRLGGHREPLGDLATLAREARALGQAAGAARDGEARDGADRRERLAPEAERRDRLEVLVAAELGGRVPLERERQVLGRDADAVVGHPDQDGAAVPQVHRDAPGGGVEAVLHELLDRGGRALDDLARRDLVDEVIGQPPDARHGASDTSGGPTRSGSPRASVALRLRIPAALAGRADPASTVRCCHLCKRLSASRGVTWARSSAASSVAIGSGAAGVNRPSWTASRDRKSVV